MSLELRLEAAWKEPGRSLERAWNEPGRGLEGAWSVPGRKGPGRGLEGAWKGPGSLWKQGLCWLLNCNHCWSPTCRRAPSSSSGGHLWCIVPSRSCLV
jgi:hypothetical protein